LIYRVSVVARQSVLVERLEEETKAPIGDKAEKCFRPYGISGSRKTPEICRRDDR